MTVIGSHGATKKGGYLEKVRNSYPKEIEKVVIERRGVGPRQAETVF